MAQKTKGSRRKTRQKLQKGRGSAGVVRKHLHSFEDGQRVLLKVDPSVHSGMPHPRFHGRTGRIEGRRGRSYVVAVMDGGKQKQFTVHPAHLREL